jgi:hypothetical protein
MDLPDTANHHLVVSLQTATVLRMAASWDASAFLAWLCGSSHDPDSARQWVTTAAGHRVDAARVNRLPVAFLAACTGTPAPHLANLPEAARNAALILGLGPALGIPVTPEERKAFDALPFTAKPLGAAVQIGLAAGSERKPGFGSALFHQWAGGISGGAITVDLANIDHINSVMIAWLLQLVQSAKPTPVEVRRAKPGVSTQLKQLRLDHLLRMA